MRLAAFVLVAVAFAIIPDGRVSAAALGPPKSSEGTHETARLLRLNAVPQPVETGNQEERTINFASIKKIVPGTSAFKNAQALKASQKAALKAQDAAKRKAAVDKWFKQFGSDEFLFTAALPSWAGKKMHPDKVREYFASLGKSGDDVSMIVKRYDNYRQTIPTKK
ncbi:hypothetical protein GN244_ATG14595 [Phytophthora infestans]|uniref:RxLR effector protein n=2 Tax=Phytophthora infestans TaxID=4787 RepID=A0A833T401_PHYIN|nr:hypothetical protein GN244_ATG14595 [Phytophthora infestans]